MTGFNRMGGSYGESPEGVKCILPLLRGLTRRALPDGDLRLTGLASLAFRGAIQDRPNLSCQILGRERLREQRDSVIYDPVTSQGRSAEHRVHAKRCPVGKPYAGAFSAAEVSCF